MKRNNDKNANPKKDKGLAENHPSKGTDSQGETKPSNDAKTDQDFPGYPHYPAREDIMDQRTGSQKVDMDLENLSGSKNTSAISQRFSGTGQNERSASRQETDEENNTDVNPRTETDADVNEDDLAVLNSTNDEIGRPQNVSNEDLDTDLDIPGSELDDANESIGEEDEENNYYSLGGDRHESQEEDPYSGPERGNV